MPRTVRHSSKSPCLLNYVMAGWQQGFWEQTKHREKSQQIWTKLKETSSWPRRQYIPHLVPAHHLLWEGAGYLHQGWTSSCDPGLWGGLSVRRDCCAIREKHIVPEGTAGERTGAWQAMPPTLLQPSPKICPEKGLLSSRQSWAGALSGLDPMKSNTFFCSRWVYQLSGEQKAIWTLSLQFLKCATVCSGLSPFSNAPQAWGGQKYWKQIRAWVQHLADCRSLRLSGNSCVVDEAAPLTPHGVVTTQQKRPWQSWTRTIKYRRADFLPL